MKVFYKAPNNVSVVANPLGSVLSDQAVHSIDVNRDRLFAVARLLRAQAQLAASDTGLLVWWLDHEDQMGVLYGVDPTGAADSLAALNALARACVAAGGATAVLPRRGIVKVSDTWLLGNRYVNEADVGYGDSQTPSYDGATSYSHDAYLVAANMPTVSVKGRGSVLWWGGTEPSTEKAILHWAQPQASTVLAHVETGELEDLCFAGPGAFAGSPLALQSPDTAVVPTTKVMGCFIAGSSLSASRLTVRECGRGIVESGSFWSTLDKATAWHCKRGFQHLDGNASEVGNLVASYCVQAFEISGQGMTVGRLATEQCGQKYEGLASGGLWVPDGDQIEIGGTYLESVGSAIKDYSIRFGQPVNLGLYSEQIDNGAAWGYVSSVTNPTVAPNVLTAPDSSLTGDEVTFANAVANGGQWDYLAQNFTVVSGHWYTISAYMEQGRTSPATSLNLQVRNGPDAGVACALGADWQRFSLTFQATISGLCTACIGDSGIGPYTMTAGKAGIWGVMVNEGKSAAPYKRTTSAASTPGPGVVWAKLKGVHLSSEQGRTMDLINTELYVESSRFYDQGASKLRVRGDSVSGITAVHSSVPIDTVGSDDSFQVQTTDATNFGMAWIYTVPDSQNIAAGRSTYKDLVGYSGVHVNDEVVCTLSGLPPGWLARAEVVVSDTGGGGTIRITLLNGTNAVGDAPTMTGVFHVRHTHDVTI